MGPVERLRESVQTPSGNRPVPWHAAKLLQQSDSDRHVTILFFPGYLETDGYELWDEPYAVVRQALEWLIGDHVGVGSCSMHWGEEFYFELRLDGHPAEPDGLLPAQLRDRWSQGPDWIEDYLATNEAETYWRRIALRIPSMRASSVSRAGLEPSRVGSYSIA